MKQTLEAVKKSKMQHLIIFPNNDAGSKKILKLIEKSKMNFVSTLSLSEYKTLLSSNMILVGNSSSGIHEAASFKVPVVNIGTRQQGRYKPKNIISVDYDEDRILSAINYCKTSKFKKKISNLENPYGDGKSAQRIVKIIKKLKLKNFNTQKQLTY